MINEPKVYTVAHRRSEYVIPTEARADRLTFDETYMHIHLQDGRIISVPLDWAPSLASASPEARERYTIGWDGALLVWDPDDGEINEDLLVAHYLRGGIEQV